MKKRIAMVLVALAIVSSLGSSAVMARGPVCPCGVRTTKTEETVVGRDIYGHTLSIRTYEECDDCGTEYPVSTTETWASHSMQRLKLVSYVETDDTGITSTKYIEYRQCPTCSWVDTVEWEVIH